MTTKFGFNKLQTSLYHTVQNMIRYLELFSHGSPAWRQTDRRTEWPLAIALPMKCTKHEMKCTKHDQSMVAMTQRSRDKVMCARLHWFLYFRQC